MPLARTFDVTQGRIVSTAFDGYMDRLSKWSDIQDDLPFLYETAKSREKVRVLELGTRRGNSTLAFLAAAEAADGHVWSSDIFPVLSDPNGMRPWSRHPRWTFIQGDDTDPVVQAQLPAEVDVLFIDTSHLYEHTLQELHAFMPRVVKGGIALFHDTDLYMNVSGVEDDYPQVSKALNEYCRQTGHTWVNRTGKYGLGYIQL